MLHLCSLISLVSVSANTPRTFEMHHELRYITLAADLFVTLLFTTEMIIKMHSFGIIRVSGILVLQS
ncbi:hypothetical protein HAZT_HAZT012042 [Hyalella azteca]|uniref:Ion transport domain-containing protein n=1 Tax=Hyalella azteca TaxID=294128 RepID=A0A6A0H2T9_HYAAZ|nr:hypothetical protein HAZT_HAZT012042 [Hyalella azteca]